MNTCFTKIKFCLKKIKIVKFCFKKLVQTLTSCNTDIVLLSTMISVTQIAVLPVRPKTIILKSSLQNFFSVSTRRGCFRLIELIKLYGVLILTFTASVSFGKHLSNTQYHYGDMCNIKMSRNAFYTLNRIHRKCKSGYNILAVRHTNWTSTKLRHVVQSSFGWTTGSVTSETMTVRFDTSAICTTPLGLPVKFT